MANPRTLRTGLANRLRTITGLEVYERWPGQINPPCAVIGLADAEPEQNMGGGELTKWNFDIFLFVSLAGGPDNAQVLMDPYLSSSTGGVYGAVKGDPTLGSIAHTTIVGDHHDYEQVAVNEQLAYLGCIVDCEVWAS